MDNLHSLYLEMMNEFHDFCKKNNLTYYMVGGTLLGAVRNQGFIAWDDDVDLAMPRPDYEKFIRTYNGNLKLKNRHNDHGHFFPYTIILNSSTPFVQIQDPQQKMVGKILVHFDLYPVDGLGNNIRKANRITKKISFLKNILYK